MDGAPLIAAGVDAGTEYVKAVVADADGKVLGRGAVPTRGYFEACSYEALAMALDEAQQPIDALASICATGFGMECVPRATMQATETSCHALGAFRRLGHAMTLVDIGGRDPHVISVDGDGQRTDARSVRRCATGIGSFLMFAARHLDIPSPRLEELAEAAEGSASVSSYCSVFSATEVLARLREGATREDIARGCMHSIAERIAEIGGFQAPVAVCGGVAEYYPSVVRGLEALTGLAVQVVPEPLFTGALGAALRGCGPRAVGAPHGRRGDVADAEQSVSAAMGAPAIVSPGGRA